MSIIVDEQGDEYEWDTCPWCDGTGDDIDAPWTGEACPSCMGRGSVRHYFPAYGDDDEEPNDER